jgi:hypothetical protein
MSDTPSSAPDTPPAPKNGPLPASKPTTSGLEQFAPPAAPEKKKAFSLRRVERKVREGKQPIAGLAPVHFPDVTPPEPPRRRIHFKKRWLFILLVLALIGGGILLYFASRETKFKATVAVTGVQIQPEAYVVYDFSDRVDMIRRDLAKREAPFRELLMGTMADIQAAKADLAGRQQRKKLLLDALEQDRAEIPKIINDGQARLRKLWEDKGKELDQEYADAKAAVNKQIEDRAKNLGLKYQKPEDLDAPEVAANAFRLALYGAPDTIDSAKERLWTEQLLKEWREGEKVWSAKLIEVRKQADAMRASTQPKIESIEDRISQLQTEVESLNDDLADFDSEIARHEARASEVQTQLNAVFVPFYTDLLQAPSDYRVTTLQIGSDGLIEVRNLDDKDEAFKPGKYQLFIRGVKDGIEVWALKPFDLIKHQTTTVNVVDADFQPASVLLKQGETKKEQY